MTDLDRTLPDPAALRFDIPETVSPAAAAQLSAMYGLFQAQPQAPLPHSQTEWDALAAQIEMAMGPLAAHHAAALGVTTAEDTLGGVSVLRVRPGDYRPGGRTLVHLHGGAYVLFSPRSALSIPALLASAGGDEVISIDYTLAPRGNWRTITDQVLAVWKALLATGAKPSSFGFLGDSAGGSLAAGSVLKARDQGLPLPGALYLNSPWADITATGDTYKTLAEIDPILTLESLAWSAAAYAASDEQKHPYVSPVYGDYTNVFPPTLLQGGTRDMFMSNVVRLYQEIRTGGGLAVLDLYEGLPHVFQPLAFTAPETQTSIKRAIDFLHTHLQT